MIRSVWLAIAVSVLPVAAFAGEDLHIGHGWMAATDETTVRVFLEIENEGSEAVTLIGARSDVAGATAIAGPPLKANSSALVVLPEYPIAPGAELHMEPDGLYLLLTDAKGPFKEGTEFDMVLTFAPGGDIEVHVDVEGPNAESESHEGHNH